MLSESLASVPDVVLDIAAHSRHSSLCSKNIASREGSFLQSGANTESARLIVLMCRAQDCYSRDDMRVHVH